MWPVSGAVLEAAKAATFLLRVVYGAGEEDRVLLEKYAMTWSPRFGDSSVKSFFDTLDAIQTRARLHHVHELEISMRVPRGGGTASMRVTSALPWLLCDALNFRASGHPSGTPAPSPDPASPFPRSHPRDRRSRVPAEARRPPREPRPSMGLRLRHGAPRRRPRWRSSGNRRLRCRRRCRHRWSRNRSRRGGRRRDEHLLAVRTLDAAERLELLAVHVRDVAWRRRCGYLGRCRRMDHLQRGRRSRLLRKVLRIRGQVRGAGAHPAPGPLSSPNPHDELVTVGFLVY